MDLSSSSTIIAPSIPVEYSVVVASLAALSRSNDGALVKHHEALLLNLRSTHPDELVASLLAAFSSERDDALRLASLLALKAVVSEKWMPRGRKYRPKQTTFEGSTGGVAPVGSSGAPPDNEELAKESKMAVRAFLCAALERTVSLALGVPLQNGVISLVCKLGRMDTMSDNVELLPTLLRGLTSRSDFASACLNKVSACRVCTPRFEIFIFGWSRCSSNTVDNVYHFRWSQLLKECATQRLMKHKQNLNDMALVALPAVERVFVRGAAEVMEGKGWARFKVLSKICHKVRYSASVCVCV